MPHVDTSKWRRIIESGEDYPGSDPVVTAQIRAEKAAVRLQTVRQPAFWMSTSVGEVPDQSVEEKPSSSRVSVQPSTQSMEGVPFERYVQAQEEWKFQVGGVDTGNRLKRD